MPDTIHPLPTYTRDASAGLDALADTEWLLTNGLGGYAMGTVLGIPTRRYHALLVAAMSPPVQREVMLSSIFETLIFAPGTPEERAVDLSSYRFKNAYMHPHGWRHLVRFEKSDRCRWFYQAEDVGLEKSVYLYRERNAVAITYTVRPASTLVRLQLRPLLAMRDAYGLLRAGGGFGDIVAHGFRDHIQIRRWGRTLEMTSDTGRFHSDGQWWHDFEYEAEQKRGLDQIEDLFSPGCFNVQAGAGRETSITITAWLGEAPPEREEDARANRERRIEIMRGWEGPISRGTGSTDVAAKARKGTQSRSKVATVAAPGDTDDLPVLQAQLAAVLNQLALAADDFIVRRRHRDVAKGGTSIIAGYPWFSDWGRDSMISLPGLLLCTGRHTEARRVLETFARHRRHGLIPNVFHDHSGAAEYNTLDGSLWFLHAACAYLQATGDRDGFNSVMRPACLDIIDHYRAGTDFNIRMDDDGLIAAGDESTQLTWMDAKRDGVVFTPRHGKAVEINALWHHGLRSVAAALEPEERRKIEELRGIAERVARSFREKFWNTKLGCCYDILTPDGAGLFVPGAQVRPNQIFAVSLEHSPLEFEQQQKVVAIARERLLTPHGLRTLDPADPGYKGRFQGDMFERDSTYHNGTVWPWLIGPYCEAMLRVDGFTQEACEEVVETLKPLLARIDGESLGQLPEVFDGDDTPDFPQQPGGCIAQAWSIAEVLRVLMLATSAGRRMNPRGR